MAKTYGRISKTDIKIIIHTFSSINVCWMPMKEGTTLFICGVLVDRTEKIKIPPLMGFYILQVYKKYT